LFGTAIPVAAIEFDKDGGVGESSTGFDDEDGEGFSGIFEDDRKGAILKLSHFVASEGFRELDAISINAGGVVIFDKG